MPESEPRVIETHAQRIWLDPASNIMMVEFEDNAALEIEHARASTQAMLELSGGAARPLLIDFTNLLSQSKECRKHYTSDPGHKETYIAVAILVTNPLSRMLANFFLVLNKSGKPTKLFTDRDKALAWLRPYA